MYLDTAYGGIEGYLERAWMAAGEMSRLHDILTEPA
jgi:hypothetical protein